ncbi:GFA family protein [Inquilinus sp.]|uniref:GFA family protein n=1 Tax=Inquilinus sp. TaxID=1932117 RepID=UPI0031D05FCD
MAASDSAAILTDGCQCGKVRYEVGGPRLGLYVCHCRECRKQSASAFGISAFFRSAGLRLVSGELQSWSRTTKSGWRLISFFCPACGSRVWHGDKDREAEICIKGGSLDEPPDLTGAVHIWTSRTLPGVIIPEQARRHAEDPD